MSIGQTGGPAFPVKASEAGYGQYDSDGVTVQHTGLTLRDYFASAALTGLAANSKWNVTKQAENCAKSAYELADAMLEARNANR